jgi:hypothetical protein
MKDGIINTKIENIVGDTVYLVEEDGTRSTHEIGPFPTNLRHIGAFVRICRTTITTNNNGTIVYTYELGEEFVTKCTCPTKCDCQKPPPPTGRVDGEVYGISSYCPIHNDNPRADPECPIHGDI